MKKKNVKKEREWKLINLACFSVFKIGKSITSNRKHIKNVVFAFYFSLPYKFFIFLPLFPTDNARKLYEKMGKIGNCTHSSFSFQIVWKGNKNSHSLIVML